MLKITVLNSEVLIYMVEESGVEWDGGRNGTIGFSIYGKYDGIGLPCMRWMVPVMALRCLSADH